MVKASVIRVVNSVRMVLVWSPPELSRSPVSSIDVDGKREVDQTSGITKSHESIGSDTMTNFGKIVYFFIVIFTEIEIHI